MFGGEIVPLKPSGRAERPIDTLGHYPKSRELTGRSRVVESNGIMVELFWIFFDDHGNIFTRYAGLGRLG